MNSVIEAQQTLREEQEKELIRCEDPFYFYKNYIHIKGNLPPIELVGIKVKPLNIQRNLMQGRMNFRLY